MLTRYALLLLVAGTVAQTALAQNSNSSTSAPARPRATNTNSQPKTTGQQTTGTQKPAASQAQKKPVVATEQPIGSDGVLAAPSQLHGPPQGSRNMLRGQGKPERRVHGGHRRPPSRQ